VAGAVKDDALPRRDVVGDTLGFFNIDLMAGTTGIGAMVDLALGVLTIGITFGPGPGNTTKAGGPGTGAVIAEKVFGGVGGLDGVGTRVGKLIAEGEGGDAAHGVDGEILGGAAGVVVAVGVTGEGGKAVVKLGEIGGAEGVSTGAPVLDTLLPILEVELERERGVKGDLTIGAGMNSKGGAIKSTCLVQLKAKRSKDNGLKSKRCPLNS